MTRPINAEVEVRNNNIDAALRCLKHLIGKQSLPRQLREKRFFISKSERKRIKAKRNFKRLTKKSNQ
jgi:ribosomal protein S21